MGTLLNVDLMLLTESTASSGMLWHTTTAAGRFTPAQPHKRNTNFKAWSSHETLFAATSTQQPTCYNFDSK
jgi:hypothetical protein